MAKKLDQKHTQKLDDDDNIVLPSGIAYGTNKGLRGMLEFIPMPDPSQREPGRLKNPWQITLSHPNPAMGVIGLEIHDDVVLGRASKTGKNPDLDLTLMGAGDEGVSRRHAKLRPSNRQLFLIDLGSTNGTQINSVPINAGMARALQNNDTVILGDLHLSFKIVRTPAEADWQDEAPHE